MGMGTKSLGYVEIGETVVANVWTKDGQISVTGIVTAKDDVQANTTITVTTEYKLPNEMKVRVK